MKTARLALILPFLALAACETTTADPTPRPAPRTPGVTVAVSPAASDAAAAAAAEARTGAIPDTIAAGTLQRPAGSRSVAQLDASAAEKAAASKPVATGGRLGTTVASLGDATQGGFWIKTPLVRSIGKGRIVNPATGKSVNVDLLPLSGPASAGSQVSLPALTTLGADLTDLPEVEVYSV
ncbi:hypothetical protein [Paracoccus sphaerophysae]|uniref:D-galactarate dehydratase n=1 Tax=Paracoccus sphaerophysae TaxID=690417 RepID=A0A099FBS2_9RHOB|nr:hypothetical protein [Paracoccus sphaerophysae]KGJ07651.1 hypothetical protein IC63_07765 [Paracoccus sphaerophysae]